MIESNRLSIVLPLYKPKGKWLEQFLNNVNELEKQLPGNLSLTYIVVHDGPVDSSMQAAFGIISGSVRNIIFTSYPVNRGKGYALRQGIKLTESPLILTTDFDFPYKMKNLIEVIEFLRKGYDVVIGKRSKDYLSHLPFKRKVIYKTFVFLNWLFLDLPVHDTQSGIKGFNVNGKNIFLQTSVDRFLVDTEFVLRSYKNNLSIKVISAEVRPETEFSNFGSRVIKTELRNFLDILRLNKKLRKTLANDKEVPVFYTRRMS